MVKMTKTITLHYVYDGRRKGAKYSIDGGEHWMNHGEFIECIVKHCLGYAPCKDANTRFDKGEDIPELNASVKSQNCGLTDMKLADNKDEFLRKFWEMSNPQTTYIWAYDYGELVDIWFMDYKEFQAFTETFGSWDSYCQKIRFKTCNNKINEWLAAHI